MRRAKIGDYFTKVIEDEEYTIQFVFKDKIDGSYFRVFKGNGVKHANLIIDNFGLPLLQAQKTGGWVFAGTSDPGNVEFGPILGFDSVYPTDWYLIKGKSKIPLGETVPECYRQLTVIGVYGSDVLDHFLTTGENKYSYEKWMEYKEKFGK
ncbi:MAG: hypothetical protein WCI55_06085 [Armatimonadota bacterium]